MIWQEKSLETYDDILQAVANISSKKEAQEFLVSYKLVEPNAEHCIGWMIGDVDRDLGQRIIDLFDIGHPIFGKKFPTPEEAFTAGIKYGEFLKELR